MKILHISTHNENCGIAKYQEMYISSMEKISSKTIHKFFSLSPNYMFGQNKSEFNESMKQLSLELKDCEIVHIQHEFSFYKSYQLAKIVKLVKSKNLKLISTIHTMPILTPNNISVYSPKTLVRKIITKKKNHDYLGKVLPLKASDITFVHNDFTKDALVLSGFTENKIKIVPIPVPVIDLSSDEFLDDIAFINKKIVRKKDDIVIGAVGYINDVKGTLHSVKALTMLPSNYKLVILGGIHPRANNDTFLDEISDYIINHNLQNRVYISGFVKDDRLLNAYVSNVDILVYPYLRGYSSSSAALNNAFANSKPVVAFPAMAFKEINKTTNCMEICESFSYYDLAKSLLKLTPDSIVELTKDSVRFKNNNSYEKLAKKLLKTYEQVFSSKV